MGQARPIESMKNGLEELESLIERDLETLFSRASIVEPLRAALHHSVFPKGKRLRPLFALALCEDLGGNTKKFSSAAIALELVHCASLIHDDLPALDNDDERRGRPTCHKAFGEATAVLAGDFLVPWAIESISNSELPVGVRMDLVKALSAAFLDLCNGQQLDILPPEKRGSLEEIHRLKTGALFAAALKFGAIAAQSNWEVAATAAELGGRIGLFFQISDDLLDRFGDSEQRGRSGSSDEKNQKHTFAKEGFGPAIQKAKQEIDRCLWGLEQAAAVDSLPRTRQMVERIYQRVIGFLSPS